MDVEGIVGVGGQMQTTEEHSSEADDRENPDDDMQNHHHQLEEGRHPSGQPQAVPLNPEETYSSLLRSESSYLDNIPAVDALSIRGDVTLQALNTLPEACDIVAIKSNEGKGGGTYNRDSRSASIISVRVFKYSRGTKLGLVMKVVDGHLTISKLTDNSLLIGSPLRPGDKLLRINGEYCLGWNPYRAVDFLKEIMGPVTIVAENLEGHARLSAAAVFKNNRQDQIGITFKQHDNNLVVSKIHQSSLLGHDSAIDVDDTLVAIDDVPCEQINEPSIAVEILRSTQGWVTIVTKRARENQMLHTNMLSERHIIATGFSTGRFDDAAGVVATGVEASLVQSSNGEGGSRGQAQTSPAYISALFFKANEQSAIDIKEVHISDEKLKVSSLDPIGEASSPIKPGHELIALNGKPCASWSPDFFYETLALERGYVNIVAHNPHGDPFLVEAMLTKQHKRQKIGVRFAKQDGKIRIKEIHEDGLAMNSVLNIRDYVQSINGVSCEDKTPGWISKFIGDCPDTVVIFAKTLRSTAVVISHDSLSNRNLTSSAISPPPGTTASIEQIEEARRQTALRVFVAVIIGIAVAVILAAS